MSEIMVRYAVGIIQHAQTGRWQSWLYTEDETTQHLACLSAHLSKAQAHLVAHLVLDAYQQQQPISLPQLLGDSHESAPPDPLPPAQAEALLTLIATTAPQTTNESILTI